MSLFHGAAELRVGISAASCSPSVAGRRRPPIAPARYTKTRAVTHSQPPLFLPPVVFRLPSSLNLFSPLLHTCAINSSVCRRSSSSSSATPVSPRMSSQGKPGRSGRQRSSLFTPLPWERLSQAGPERASSTLTHAANYGSALLPRWKKKTKNRAQYRDVT